MSSGPMNGEARPGDPRAASPRVFRAPSGTVALILASIVTLLLLVDAVVRAGWGEMLLLAPWMLLVLWFIYVATFVSHVAVDARGATVQNLLRVVRIPWDRVSDIGIRYQVRFTLDDGRTVSAFGGPVAGRPPRPGLRPDPSPRARIPPALRDLELIREQWLSASETGSGAGRVVRGWDLRAIFALVVIVAWALSAVIISGANG
ncbi:PH domain-containing protein [Microbacterium sp. LKL04]|uniref:PH domain-containing protein n=1 Tax=Microbacterium sp. LKL04 TaxID=912630 RepID=UPI000B897B63|nr:PH domain-containing protein [Microbacterium sp. LKL04]